MEISLKDTSFICVSSPFRLCNRDGYDTVVVSELKPELIYFIKTKKEDHRSSNYLKDYKYTHYYMYNGQVYYRFSMKPDFDEFPVNSYIL